MVSSSPQLLSEVLERASQQSPDNGIVYLHTEGNDILQPYPALLEESQCILGGLRAIGLRPGDKVIFQLDSNRQLIPALWGCILGGFVPVPLSVAPTYRNAHSTIDKLYYAWQLFDRPVIVTSNALVSALENLPTLVPMVGLQIATVEQLTQSTPDSQWHACQPDDLALMLLTSGSTGTPKAVMHSHRSLIAHCKADQAHTQFSNTDISLNWFPLDHVGGIVMFHLRDVYVGTHQLHAPTQTVLQNPLKWIDWLHEYRVTITWAPNFAFGLINEQATAISAKSWDLSCLKFILNGGEAIVAKTARQFLQLLQPYGLSQTVMRPAWGMSETASVASYSENFSLASTTDEQTFVEVGTPLPGMAMRIVDDNQQVLPVGTIGRLQIKGSMVTLGYYAQPELTQAVFSNDGWFDTGDLGFLQNGQLTLTGRKKDVIIINGANFYSHELEAVVETISGIDVSFTAACAVRSHDSQTDQLAIFFHSTLVKTPHLLEQLQDIRKTLVSQMSVNPTYLVPLDKADIPKTAIGKIQRIQLRQRFESGEFDSILKHLDLLSANDNTLPNWFYQRQWTPKQLRYIDKRTPHGAILVFMDNLGLGIYLCQQLDHAAISYIKVSNASSFEQFSQHHYGLDPQQPQHYHQLLSALRTAQIDITSIIHLGAYRNNPEALNSHESLRMAQYHGTYSLLFLIQALDKGYAAHLPARLMVVTANLQATHPNEPTLCTHGALSGLLHTIPLELSWLSCQHLDFPRPVATAQQAALIMAELAQPLIDTEIAYRQGQRWVATLAAVDWQKTLRQPIKLKSGGLYLITGGLGGIATDLAHNLLRHYQVKLILVGRTALPPRHEWHNHLDHDTTMANKIRRLQAIGALSEDVMYRSADVCDAAALDQLVNDAELYWQQPLDGVFHLAGEGNLGNHWQEADDHWIATETLKTVEWMWRAKVYGTYTLCRHLLENRTDAIFVAFSSVNALFGGATFSAYAAANSFLDHFCHYQRTHGHPNTYSINWSLWQETGMSDSAPETTLKVSQQMGFNILSKLQGWHSLKACLSVSPGQYVVGLDGQKPNIRNASLSQCETLQKITAFFTVKDNLPITRLQKLTENLQQLELCDRFSTMSNCDFSQVSELPLLANGQVDESALQRLQLQSPQPQEYQSPQNPTEKRIVKLWQDLLRVDNVGRHHNFFELGGHSLLATQMISHIRQ
ncbi:MAG: SDR family NAD(P)-dependent oxidoreductase, partial [Cyanobacteria bacterium J06656_5]